MSITKARSVAEGFSGDENSQRAVMKGRKQRVNFQFDAWSYAL